MPSFGADNTGLTEIELDIPEMDDETLIEQLGFVVSYFRGFKAKYPDKPCFTKKGAASNEFVLYYIEKANTLEKLESVETNKLTTAQHKKLFEKIKAFKMSEAVIEEPVVLEETIEVDPIEEMYEEEDLKAEGIKTDDDIMNSYIEELAKCRRIIAKLRKDIQENKDRVILEKMIPEFIKAKINLTTTTEIEDTYIMQLIERLTK